ncbi:MAG: helix-turn-helix transcriptional regulator [Oscillospiraceae bacterium]
MYSCIVVLHFDVTTMYQIFNSCTNQIFLKLIEICRKARCLLIPECYNYGISCTSFYYRPVILVPQRIQGFPYWKNTPKDNKNQYLFTHFLFTPATVDLKKRSVTSMTTQERKAVGHRLRQQRNRLGLTREQFAELADIGAGYYGQLEVGTSQMSVDTLIKLSRTSRLSMEYILLGDVPQEQDLTPLQAMLARCTPRELHLAEKVLQLFLLRGDI